ncbi:BCCT family transporter [Brevibacterium album]|uniref:BCCT family transporter n=1 Tax=Brevibacterium album TaxID=417948 RepID=UPI0004261045|nr:BCCT family transporter [Brevibacterium album]
MSRGNEEEPEAVLISTQADDLEDEGVDGDSPESADEDLFREQAQAFVAEELGEAPESSVEELDEAEQLQERDSDKRIVGKLRAQGVVLGKGTIAPRVFWPALIVILGVAVAAIAFPDAIGSALEAINGWIVSTFGWYYMVVVAGFIAFCLFIGLSKFGNVRLGNDDDRPEFGLLSWFAMLFAAGMGIGLVFYGVGEPLGYATFDAKPGWPQGGDEQTGLAMAQTFVHWGLHPWAIYAVIGLALAYAIHRRGRPISIRWALEPLFGQAVKGWFGDLVDILAVFGTVFGIATSLGLGVQQIASGMQAIGIVDAVDNLVLVVLIVVITFIAILSVASGVGKGMKWLSNINLTLAGVLLVSVLALGPTLFLMRNFVESLGVYLANFMGMTFDSGAFTGAEGEAWNAAWTIFYWGWWISWAPFVGVFIARISRGRTIRQFIAGVLLVPSIVGFLWFSVLGGTGIWRQLYSDDPIFPEGGDVAAEAALFDMLNGLPLGAILSVIAIILVAIFFITSSDSGSLVVDMLASGGHPNPPTWSRVLWAVMEGLLAIALLLAGGLGALQAAALATALPFSVVLLLMCFSTHRALREEMRITEYARREARLQAGYLFMRSHVKSSFEDEWSDKIESRIDNRIDYRISATRGPVVLRRAGSGGLEPDTRGRSRGQGHEGR